MKDISIVIRETRQEIINVINSSGLQIDIVDMLIADMARGIHDLAEQNYQAQAAQPESGEEEHE